MISSTEGGPSPAPAAPFGVFASPRRSLIVSALLLSAGLFGQFLPLREEGNFRVESSFLKGFWLLRDAPGLLDLLHPSVVSFTPVEGALGRPDPWLLSISGGNPSWNEVRFEGLRYENPFLPGSPLLPWPAEGTEFDLRTPGAAILDFRLRAPESPLFRVQFDAGGVGARLAGSDELWMQLAHHASSFARVEAPPAERRRTLGAAQALVVLPTSNGSSALLVEGGVRRHLLFGSNGFTNVLDEPFLTLAFRRDRTSLSPEGRSDVHLHAGWQRRGAEGLELRLLPADAPSVDRILAFVAETVEGDRLLKSLSFTGSLDARTGLPAERSRTLIDSDARFRTEPGLNGSSLALALDGRADLFGDALPLRGLRLSARTRQTLLAWGPGVLPWPGGSSTFREGLLGSSQALEIRGFRQGSAAAWLSELRAGGSWSAQGDRVKIAVDSSLGLASFVVDAHALARPDLQASMDLLLGRRGVPPEDPSANASAELHLFTRPLPFALPLATFLSSNRLSSVTSRWTDDGNGRPDAGESSAPQGGESGGSIRIADTFVLPSEWGWELPLAFQWGPFRFSLTPEFRQWRNLPTLRYEDESKAGFRRTVDGQSLFFLTNAGAPRVLENGMAARMRKAGGPGVFPLDEPFYAAGTGEISLRHRAFFLLVSFTAIMAVGPDQLGNGAVDLPGELSWNAADPNAQIQTLGRYAGDRGYTARVAAGFRIDPWLSLGWFMRYKDGEPHSYLRWAEAQSGGRTWAAIRNDSMPGDDPFSLRTGRRTDSYWDAELRLESRFLLKGREWAVGLSVANLLDIASEIAEKAMGAPGAEHRVPLELQAPRSLSVWIRGGW